ncbi:MAG: DUF6265 family protein [Cytophagales bacterium]|nr:DUF6265 family protein [Cytophagales bacterium]
MIRFLLPSALHAIAGILLLAVSIDVGAQTLETAQENFSKMKWLIGTWSRTNPKPGTTGLEHWTIRTDREWSGIGVNLKGQDTTFVEKLRIVIENDRLFYVADIAENSKAIYFEITAVTNHSFTCENPSHDFPQKIEYRWNEDVLHARISAGDKAVDFFFERK